VILCEQHSERDPPNVGGAGDAILGLPSLQIGAFHSDIPIHYRHLGKTPKSPRNDLEPPHQGAVTLRNRPMHKLFQVNGPQTPPHEQAQLFIDVLTSNQKARTLP